MYMSRHIGIVSNNDVRVENTLSRDTNVLVFKIVMIYDYIKTFPFLSGIFLMTAFAIYFHEIKTDDSDGVSSDLGYGFALDILAWLAAWAAGGLFIAAKFLTKD
jgi:hypothetical protein